MNATAGLLRSGLAVLAFSAAAFAHAQAGGEPSGSSDNPSGNSTPTGPGGSSGGAIVVAPNGGSGLGGTGAPTAPGVGGARSGTDSGTGSGIDGRVVDGPNGGRPRDQSPGTGRPVTTPGRSGEAGTGTPSASTGTSSGKSRSTEAGSAASAPAPGAGTR